MNGDNEREAWVMTTENGQEFIPQFIVERREDVPEWAKDLVTDDNLIFVAPRVEDSDE